MIVQFPKYKQIYSSKNINNLAVDFTLTIEINGKIIALPSQGDPGTKLEKRLEDIANQYSPNLIICSCRTRGETVQAINKIASRHLFDKNGHLLMKLLILNH